MKHSLEIALTGATGFVGTKIISCLTANGWHVRALYRPKKGRIPALLPGVTWVAGQLNDAKVLNDFVEGVDAVIHCAGAVRGATQLDFDRVNEEGALQVARAAAQQTNMPRFLLISSLAAREPQLSYYSGSKWRGECAVKSVSEKLRWTILRPPAVYGPGDQELLPLFQSMQKGFAPTPSGDQYKLSLIYIDDLAMAILRWLETDSGYGQTFELDDGQQGGYDWHSILNIGSHILRDGKAVTRIKIPIAIFNMVARVNFFAAKLLGYAPMLTPGKVREITHLNWVADNKKICDVLGWQPKYNLQRGLALMFNEKAQVKES